MSESAIMLVVAVLGALSTLVGTVWTVRGMLSKTDVKLGRIELMLENGQARFVRIETRLDKHSEKIDALSMRNGR